MGFIYKITCKITGKPYIGLTVNPIAIRWSAHKHRAKKRIISQHTIEEVVGKCDLYDAMCAYGIENFTIEIIEEVASNGIELDNREKYWISHYNSVNDGYNITHGGRQGQTLTDESYKQMIDRIKAKIAVDIDNRRKYPDELKGLPVLCCYTTAKDKPMYFIHDHELCKYKSFVVSDYGSIENAKAALSEFLNDLIKNGVPYDPNNTINGRKSEAFKQKLSTRVKAQKAANVENTRYKYADKTRGLPQYCYYEEDADAIRVRGHEFCDNKLFTLSVYGGLENTKAEVIKFLDELKQKGTKYVPPVDMRELPKSIYKDGNGFTVRVYHKRKPHNKYVRFDESEEKTLQKAIQIRDKLIAELNQNNEE